MATLTADTRDNMVYTAASAIGILAGIRSMTAPAVLTRVANDCGAAPASAFGFFGSPHAKTALQVMAVGEMVADKLPFIPNRTALPSLTVRILTGAVCGATICSAFGRAKSVGAIAGALGAVGGTFGAFHLRRALTKNVGIPDTAVALVEDTAAVWAGKMLCERLS
jgi:uncharacterized membrane protein